MLSLCAYVCVYVCVCVCVCVRVRVCACVQARGCLDFFVLFVVLVLDSLVCSVFCSKSDNIL